MPLGPFDLTGGPFLALYCTLLVVTIIAGLAIPRWLRPEGRTRGVTEPDQIAWLAAGRPRFIDTIVTRLLAMRALALTSDHRFEVLARSGGTSAAEASVLAMPAPIRWPMIEKTLRAYAEPVEHKLVEAGLAMDSGLVLQMRIWQTLPYLLLIIFGAIKWDIGAARDRPVGFLTALLIVTALFALIRWCAVDRRTRGGIAALKEAQARSERLRQAPTVSETDLAVALFGTSVLAGSAWSNFHQLRSANSGAGGSSGGGDGGGDGGGCGGCGG